MVVWDFMSAHPALIAFTVFIGITIWGFWGRKQKEPLRETNSNYSLVLGSYEWYIKKGGKQNFWENEDDATVLLLDGYIAVNTFGRILIESIELNIGGQICKSDWESSEYIGFDEPSIQFEIPLNTQRGKRTVRIQAIVDGTPFVGKPLILDLPQGKRVFRR